MNFRTVRWASVSIFIAAVTLASTPCWAVYYALGSSKDEWGLKYDVQVAGANNGKVTVTFTLADEGRLKSIHSATVVAFSQRTDSQGGRGYDVKAPITFTTNAEGKRSGQVQIDKVHAHRAMIRILTLTVDGRRQTAGAAYYDIPLNKFITKTPFAGSPRDPAAIASPPTAKVTK